MQMSMTAGAGFVLYWPALCARERGLYAAEGLEVSLVVLSEPDAGAALASGSIPFARRGPDPHVGVIDAGAPVALIGGLVAEPPVTLFARPEIASVAELAGRTLAGVASTDAGTTLLRAVLAAAGVPRGSYALEDAGGAAGRFEALRAGHVAAALLSPPASAKARAEGLRPLVRLAERFRYPYATLQTYLPFAQEHAAAVSGLLRAEMRAVRWLCDPAHRADAIGILAAAAGLTLGDATAAYEEAVAGAAIYARDAALTAEDLAAVLALLAANGGVTARRQAEHYLDLRFRDAALAGG